MKVIKIYCPGMVLFLAVIIQSLNAGNSFQYVSPKPNSKSVSEQTNIILRNADDVDRSTLSPDLISVIGSVSGTHTGDLLLSDDQKTIVFNPHTLFASDEVVNVTLRKGLKTIDGTELSEYSFTFQTSRENLFQNYDYGFYDDDVNLHNQSHLLLEENTSTATLPAPTITIDSVNNPTTGHIFMATWDRNFPHVYGNYIFVLDETGQIVDSLRVNGAAFDFKVQPNGLLSFALGDFAGIVPLADDELRHLVLDSELTVVDSFKMKNGYPTDFHEFLLLPNGHAMMMSYHYLIYDMSKIIPGGKTDCNLVINIIQEQDRDKNVVFEWRNIDYIPIEDSDLNLTDSRINYGTLNAFKIDNDGNILTSWRNHSEIMKINRQTGEVMWRMGSPRGNISFVGEHEENAPYYFSRQHDIQRLENGNISLFDNGSTHQPPVSRGVEYALDEENMIATLVSEALYPSGNIFTPTAGNAQKLPGGGWFVGYGILFPKSEVSRNVVEYHADGSVAMALSLPKNVISYRTYKMPWKNEVQYPTDTQSDMLVGNTYIYNNSTDTTGISIKYVEIIAGTYSFATITRFPYGPLDPQFIVDPQMVYPVSFQYEGASIASHSSEIHIDLSVYPEIKNPGKVTVYQREVPGQGLFIALSDENYDSDANELVFTTTGFGEFIFVETELVNTAQTPIPYEPVDGKKVLAQDSLVLRWTGRGFYDMFQVQISTDSTFSTILTDSTCNSSFVWLDSLKTDSTYFWRVRSILELDESNWSKTWKFESTDAIISIISPNGGEKLSPGESIVIRWETNIADSLQLDLYQKDQELADIGNALGSVSAFTWQISADLVPDSSYKIQIMSMEDPSLMDISDSAFSLAYPIGIEIISQETQGLFSLSQNYPNPFNSMTKIKFSIPTTQNVKIEVFNTIGQLVGKLDRDDLQAGSHEIEFNASHLQNGIYFYRLQAGEYVGVKKMILRK